MRVHMAMLLALAAGILVGCQSTPRQDRANPKEDPNAIYKKQRRVGDLNVGDSAPDFTLEAADGSGSIQLSSFEGSREVVLIFGSYT